MKPENIMIIRDDAITEKICKMFHRWKCLEQLSRRQDRKKELVRKESQFREDMDIPFNILRKDGEQILRQAGIISWEEDLIHLRNQLNPKQIGSCDGYDMRQLKKDNRVQYEEELKKKKEMKEKRDVREQEELVKIENEASNILEMSDDDDVLEDNDDKEPMAKKVKNMDVMGQVSRTADARGLSIRDRTALAAAAMNAVGIDIKETNINVTSAHRKAIINRMKIAETVKTNFECPERVSVHYDEK